MRIYLRRVELLVPENVLKYADIDLSRLIHKRGRRVAKLMHGKTAVIEAGGVKVLIDDRLHHLPSELSGGQRQRVAAARALINRPDILFADEPTGNLDRDSAGELIDLLLATRAELGQTLVMVTHDPAVAARADRIYHMENGVLREQKPE